MEDEGYLRFIGTVILLKEGSHKKNVHYDSPSLVSTVYDVIDGQQRLSTLAIIAIIFSKKLSQIKNFLDSDDYRLIPTVADLNVTIDNKLIGLQELYSFDCNKSGVDPRLKPIVIRVLD